MSVTDPKACLPRSAGALLQAITVLDVEHNPKYQRRDVTGDGRPETFCNVYVEDLLKQLGLLIQPNLLAHYQIYWLDSAAGRAMGWQEVTTERARIHAEYGLPVVCGWVNPAGHSHIALCRPPPFPNAPATYITQAGATCHSCCTVAQGFGDNLTRFWFHS